MALTTEEATRIAAIASGADGGCYHCAAQLAGALNEAFPEFDWFALVGEAGRWSREMMEEAYLG